MRLIPMFLAVTAHMLCGLIASTSHAQNLRADSADERPQVRSVNVGAILISASNEDGPSDNRLSAYEATLRRTLPFSHFTYLGESSTRIAMPGNGAIALSRGQSVKIEAAYYGEKTVWMRVIWMDGGRQRINLVFARQERGVPVVVSGGVANGSNLAIIVTPR